MSISSSYYLPIKNQNPKDRIFFVFKIIWLAALVTFMGFPSATSIAELKNETSKITASIVLPSTQLNQLQKQETIPANYEFKGILKYGQKSEDVKYLQIFLKSQGPKLYPKGAISGHFDGLTKKAVIRFQKKHSKDAISLSGLTKERGVVGPKTLTMINAILREDALIQVSTIPEQSGSASLGVSAVSPHPGSNVSATQPQLNQNLASLGVNAANKDSNKSPPIQKTSGTNLPPQFVIFGGTITVPGVEGPQAAVTDNAKKDDSTTTFGATSAADVTPPIISSVSAINVSSFTATITWATDEPSDSQVNYGATKAMGTFSQVNSTMSTSQSINLYSLSLNLPYYYVVISKDAAGNSATSAQYSFTTAYYDTLPPIRSNGQPTSALAAGTTQTNISFSTNETATCRYSTAQGVSYSAMANTFNATNSLSHSTTVSGLSDGNAYNYYVRCQDWTGGNMNTDDFNISFSVQLPDLEAPQVSITEGSAEGSIVDNSTVRFSFTGTDNKTPANKLLFAYQLNNQGYSNYANPNTVALTNLTEGDYTFSVKAKDEAGNESQDSQRSFSVALKDNQAPETTITAGPDEGEVLAVDSAVFTFTGTDNKTATANLVYSYQLDNNAYLSYAALTTITLTNLSEGSHTFSVKAKDEAENEDATAAKRSFSVALPDTEAPEVTITDGPAEGSIVDNSTVRFSFTGTDNKTPANKLLFAYQLNNQGYSNYANPNTVALPNLSEGNYTFSVKAKDEAGNESQASQRSFSVALPPLNQPPVLNPIGDKSVDENSPLTFSLSATDLDKDTLIYSATNLPLGVTLVGTSFNWAPTYEQAGSYNVTFSVSDGKDSDSETITISVTDVNRPPVLDPIGNRPVNETELLEFSIFANDPDGDTLTYAAANLPIGAGLVGQDFSWTPSVSQTGTYPITFSVNDDKGGADSETITITVSTQVATVSFTIEAEDFTTQTGVKIWDDSTTVSNGKYVEFIDDVGYISTNFSVSKAGNYLIVPYVLFDFANEHKYASRMGDANTMYMSIDGGAETQIGQISDYNRWFYVSGIMPNLSAGQHTLKIMGREWPNRVDLVVFHELTPQLDPYPNPLFTNQSNPPYVWKDSYWAVWATAVGQQSYRREIYWGQTEPIPGLYQWDISDAMISELKKINGSWTLVADINYRRSTGPAWALPAVSPTEEQKVAFRTAYKRFVNQSVKRFGIQNIVYEMINEPNDVMSPTDYTLLLKAGYAGAKEANPGATVLFGGTDGVVQSWVQQVFAAGALGSFDDMNIHPYGGYFRSFEEHGMDKVLDNFAAFLRSNGVDPAKTWWTEYATLQRNQECCHTQSRIVSRDMLLGVKSGFPVARMIPYVYEGGSLWGNKQPNDAGYAFKFIQQNFNKATYIGTGSLELPPDVKSLLFKRDNDQILAIYSLDSQAQQITIQGLSSLTLYDYKGSQQNAALTNGSITLTVEGDVQYLVIPSGDQPYTSGYNYGQNFAAASSGAKATASSERSGNPVSYIIDGIPNANGTANSYQWNDTNPGVFPDWAEIDLGKEQEINTIILYMHSNNSSPGSLRDFDLQVQEGGVWKTIQSVQDNYNYWVLKYQFAPLKATKLRLNIFDVNEGLDNACCGGDRSYLYSRLYEVEAYRASADTTAPVRSNAQPTGTLPTGTTQATLSLTTDEDATVRYSTTPGISYDSMVDTFTNTGSKSHSTLVTGLSDGNTYTYYIKAKDTSGNANTDDFIISFSVAQPQPVNRAPVLEPIGNKSINENALLNFAVSATDADGDTLTYSVTSLPTGSTLVGQDYAWTPTYEQAGSYPVTFTVSDGKGSDAETITIAVNDINRAPILEPIGNKTIDENFPLTLTLSAIDPDGDTLTYAAANLPTGAGLIGSTFSWTPTYEQAGSYNATFSVSDGKGGVVSETITIIVTDVNRAPVLEPIGNKSISENTLLSFTVSATDPDKDILSYALSGLPAEAVLKGQDFSWTPDFEQAGSYNATFSISDGKGGTDTEVVTITITDVNRVPVLNPVGNQSVNEAELLSFSLSATDADSDTLTYSANDLPTGATLVGASFSWTPNPGQTGSYSATFSVNDGKGGVDSETITITVNQLSDTTAPDTTITNGPSEGSIINTNTVTFGFSGTDNRTSTNNLVYSYQLDAVSWSAYSANTSVTLTNLSEASHTFQVKARDEAGNEDTIPAQRTFTIKLPPPATVSFTIEAESFTTQTGVAVKDDATVSGGKYIEFGNNTNLIRTNFSVSKTANYLIVPYAYFDSTKRSGYIGFPFSVDSKLYSWTDYYQTWDPDYDRWIYISARAVPLTAGTHQLQIASGGWPTRLDFVVVHELTSGFAPYPYPLFVNKSNPPFNVNRSADAGPNRWAYQAKSTGNRAFRMNYRWEQIEPIPGFYQWDKNDAIVSQLKKIDSNWTILMLPSYGTELFYGPSWSSPAGPVTPEIIAAFGRFVGETVKHFGTENIAYEIINEPNQGRGGWEPYQGRGSPTDYAALLKSAYTNAKQANPQANIIFGGPEGIPIDWIQRAFQAGALGSFDEIAIHPYTSFRSFEELGQDKTLENFAAFLKSNSLDSAKAWWTEYGTTRWRNPQFNTQARLVSRGMLLGLQYGCPVGKMTPYIANQNAFTTVVNGTLTNYDTGNAYKFIEDNFGNAVFNSSLKVPPDIRALIFRRPDDQIIAIWSLDTPAQNISIQGISQADLYDYQGNQQSVNVSNNAVTLAVVGDIQYLIIPAADKPYTTGYDYGPNLAAASSGAKVSASSANSNYPARYIIDGIPNANARAWSDNTPSAFPDWVEIDFGGEKIMDTVILYTFSNNATSSWQTGGLRDFDVQVWQNNSWQTIKEVRSNYEYWVLKYQFDPVTTSKIRILIYAVNDGLNNSSGIKDLYSRLYEVEAYGASVDTTAPVRSTAQPTGTLIAGTTQATLSLTTDEDAIVRYSLLPNISYESMVDTFSNTGSKSHSTLVTGLSDGNTYTYYIKAKDTSGNANTDDFIISFSVAQAPLNQPPVLDPIGDKSINENALLSFSLSATDADGDALTYSTSALPTGATFKGQDFSWTPDYAQAGSYKVTFSVSDGKGSDSETITISVTDVNRPPVLDSIGNKSVDENSLLAFSLSATDADGDTLTYSAAGLPTGATFAGATFNWTPTYDQAGSYPVSFNVNDGNGGSDSEVITITVTDINRAPVLEPIGNKSVNENSLLNFSLSATDADKDTLSYSTSALPTGASFKDSTFNWTPNSDQAGTYPVTFSVSDGKAGVVSETITITVNNVNRAPVLSAIGDQSVDENAPLSFSLIATDLDKDTLTYALSGLPANAVLQGQDFSWTPTYEQADSYKATFSVNDGKGGSDTQTITIIVTDVNRAPVLDSIGNKSINENSLLTFIISATDADGDTLTYSTSALPTGATFADSTFNWTPTYTQAGAYPVTFSVSDGKDNDSETVTITVTDVNRAPVLDSIDNKSVNENSLLTFIVSATDADKDTLTYSTSALPAGANLNGQDFSWTPTYEQAGSYKATFSVSDGKAGVVSETITITVNDISRPPVLEPIGNKSVNENSLLSFTLSATDPDGDSLTYAATDLPTGATLVGTSFNWTPDYTQAGSYNVTFTVTDGKGGTDTQTITITVSDTNQSPVLNPIGNKSVDENSLLSFLVNATDPDKDTLTYAATGLPTGATFAGATFNWTPTYEQAGSYNVTFTVSDGKGSDAETITIAVNDINRAPILEPIGNKTIDENSLLSFLVNATDPDKDTLTYSAANLPSGATFADSTFSWTPGLEQAGSYNVTFSVSDAKGGADSEIITITVNDINRAPVLEPIGNKSVDENSLLSFSFSATDADKDTLTYSAVDLPAGSTLVGQDFSWTPTYDQAGSYPVSFNVNDGKGGSDTQTITITVNNVNQPPVLSAIGNQSVNENSLLSFSLSAIDADGDTLIYSSSALPTGATFAGATFNWTPTYEQAGSYDVTFDVSDGKGGTDTQTITIIVTDVNRAPVLEPIGDKSVDENSLLSFSLSATDADNDTLTYSAADLPAGAIFNGQDFSWTPTYEQAGSYKVTLSVSDGKGGSDPEVVTITVTDVNRAPVLEPIGNKSVNETELLEFIISATDADKDTLTYAAIDLPAGATFVGQDYSWTPDYTQAGSYNVTFSVSDGKDSDSETITISVTDVNRAPVLDPIGNRPANETELLEFTIFANDPDGDTLTYSATNLPQGATFAGQALSWTPNLGQAGAYSVTFSVSDAKGGSDSETITITVSAQGNVTTIDFLQNLNTKINALDLDYVYVDSVNNRFYATGNRSNSIVVVNGDYSANSYSISKPLLTTYEDNKPSRKVDGNPVTDKCYFLAGSNRSSRNYAYYGDLLGVIDNAKKAVSEISLGTYNYSNLLVNDSTNKVYLAGSRVAVVDGETLNITPIITAAGTYRVFLNKLTNKIYAVDSSNSKVYVIDGTSNSIIDTRTIAGSLGTNNGLINPNSNRIYLLRTYSGATIQTLNLNDFSFNQVALPAYRESFGKSFVLNAVMDEVYLSDDNYARIAIVKGSSPTTYTEISMPASGLNAIEINENTQKLYAYCWRNQVLYELDLNTKFVKGIGSANLPSEGHYSYITVNPVTNKIYLPALYGSSIVEIDGTTYAQKNIELGWGPVSIAKKPDSSIYYVVNSNKTLALINNDSVSKYITLPQWFPRKIQVNPITNKGYIPYGPEFTKTGVMIVDGNNNEAVTAKGLRYQAPSLAINTNTKKIYIGQGNFNWNPGATTMALLDENTNNVTYIMFTGYPTNFDLLTLNKNTNKIYSVTYQEVYAIDGADNTSMRVPSPTLTDRWWTPNSISIDPSMGKLYITYYKTIWSGNNALLVFNTDNNTFTSNITMDSTTIKGIVNTQARKVYVINKTNITVVDGNTNAIIDKVALPSGITPDNGIVDEGNDLVYLTAHNANSIKIFRFNSGTREITQLLSGDYPYGNTLLSWDSASGKTMDNIYIRSFAYPSGRITDMLVDSNKLLVTDYLSGKMWIISNPDTFQPKQ